MRAGWLRCDVRKRTAKARLRCDCEQLHASVAPGLKKALHAERCDAIYAEGGEADKTDEPTAIARALQQLLGRPWDSRGRQCGA